MPDQAVTAEEVGKTAIMVSKGIDLFTSAAHLISGVVTDKGIYSPFNLPRYFDSKVEQFY
ncbi:MAG: hypothetical protein GX763_06795 [Clostridiaceae bacterium]|nr:hypothetical protein [Clostridiaceae bacterium]